MYLFLLALSLNLDSLSIGVSYGLKKIKMPFPALFTIVFMSISSIGLSWYLGSIIFLYISSYFAKFISSILLITLGVTLFIQAKANIHYQDFKEEVTIKRLKIKSLNIIIDIIREPSSGDIDNSGQIDIKEAIYIGLALSLDALTIGLSLAAYPINIVSFMIISGTLNLAFIVIGQLIGKYLGKLTSENNLKLASGFIIIILGLTKLVM